MSSVGYNYNHRFSPHSVPFLNYDHGDANECLGLPPTSRHNHRNYPVGGPVGGPRGRPFYHHDEQFQDNGSARRRIAVACARCRKRKIRCSGDVGDGTGCANCKAAGIAPTQCLFHRVGSDQVQKVMDNLVLAHNLTSFANSTPPYPVYSTASHTPLYNRPTASQFDQLDTKSMFPPPWTNPYPEETSPIENYGLGQQTTYSHTTNSNLVPNTYGVPSRWTYSTKKSSEPIGSTYYSPITPFTNGPPYSQSATQTVADHDVYSSMNMSSLQMSLPDRPQVLSDRAPQRQLLPIPQPSSVQASRNAVDQMQHQRLRSAQAAGASSISGNSVYTKPLLSWIGDNNNPVDVNCATSIDSSLQLTTTKEETPEFPMAATSTGCVNNGIPTSQFQLNFSTPGLLDPITAPSPRTTYSNFRENRQSGDQLPYSDLKSDPQFNMYSFNTKKATKKNLRASENSKDSTLVSGHRYSPLAPTQSVPSTTIKKTDKEYREEHSAPLHRSSIADLNHDF